MKSAVAAATLILVSLAASDASAGRYIPGNAHRIGVRNAGMGGNHVALGGAIAGAFTNPATIRLPQDATVFAAEGFVADGPEFETRGGSNLVRSRQDSPPLLIGFATTYKRDYAFAIVDGLRYDSRYTGRLLSVDDEQATITDYQEEVRLSTTGLAVSTHVLREWDFGLALYYDRQKVFKRVDYTPKNDAFRFDDYEAFGTATALHGGVGALWQATPTVAYGLAFQTSIDLRNNLTVQSFPVNITPTPDNPNNFFTESFPVSEDQFPWNMTIGTHRALRPTTDLYADITYVHWKIDPDRTGIVTGAVGFENRRASGQIALRAGLYTQPDPSKYEGTASLTEEDLRLLDLRSATTSASAGENNEIFFTGGLGVRASYFLFDLSVEDSHLISDFGRTIVKLGFTALLPST
ncbi:MAG: hypothetical protein ACKVU1_06840 [bacterium]